ncbi:MAG: fibronectin type III domain-containing protein, partial [Actinomycetota bacterium]|nr:fibronectin type III domain-containing protein [Actinomycetota bacterium]
MRARLAAGLVALLALALLAVAVAAPASAARRPPSPVRDLQIASAASDSLLVSWAPPRRQGSSPVIGYRVTATAGTVTVSGSTAMITGLSPGSPVSVSVAARNADGRSRTRTLQASTSSGASQEAIDYYISVALGCEYGCDGSPGAVRRFTGPVEWSVDGSVSDADRLTMNAIVADWNAACPATPVSVVTTATTNPVRLHLVPLDQMATAVPQYVAGNWGFFWYWSNGDGSLQRGEVVVATDIS